MEPDDLAVGIREPQVCWEIAPRFEVHDRRRWRRTTRPGATMTNAGW